MQTMRVLKNKLVHLPIDMSESTQNQVFIITKNLRFETMVNKYYKQNCKTAIF